MNLVLQILGSYMKKDVEKEIIDLREKLWELMDENGITQDKLASKAGDKYPNTRGYSTASLSKFIGRRNYDPEYLTGKRAIKKLKILEQLCHQIIEEEAVDETPKKSSDKLSAFYNNHWYLYYLLSESYSEHNTPTIARAILHIRSKPDSVSIDNSGVPRGTDFKGRFELQEDRYLLFFLKTALHQEGYLFINAFMGRGKIPALSLGIYSNMRRNHSEFIGGSIILEHLPKMNKEQLQPSKIFMKGDDDETLRPEIKQFFKDPRINQMFVPHNILSYHDLARYNEAYRNK